VAGGATGSAGVGGSVVGAPGWRESGKRLVREAADVNAALTCVLVLRNAPPTPWLPKEMHGRRLRGDSTAGYAQYHAAFPAFATIVGELSSWGLSIAFAANTITVVAVCARDGSSSRLYGCSSQS
jgi:hypothetical protein